MIYEKMLASVVHFTRDSIIITNKDLDPPGPFIVYVNPGFTAMTGYEPHEVIGRSPRILQGPKTDPAVTRRLKETLEKGGVFFGQAVNYRKDGSEFWNEWHIEPIKDADGQVTHYVAIQRDVTERKKIEEAIEQKNAALREVLEQVSLEKQNIARNVSSNAQKIILPALKKLRRKASASDRAYFDVLEKNLLDLTSTFGANVSGQKYSLSPREVEVANLIKSGFGSKEIAAMLNMSFKTVETHRNKIRKKFGLLNTDINLTTYLQTI